MSLPSGGDGAYRGIVQPWEDGLRWRTPTGSKPCASILDARMGYLSRDPASEPCVRLGEWEPGVSVDRRRSPRDGRIILTAREREFWNRIDRSRSVCSSSWATFTRRVGGTEELMMVPRKCGCRACRSCGEVAQRYHIERIQDDWKLFLTLTCPPDRDPVDWWRIGHEKIGLFVRWLRREVKAGRARLAGSLDGAVPVLRYTWNVEAMERSLLPHWHLLCNVEWLDYARAREAWQEILGVEFAWVNVSRVRSRLHAIRYVAKYVAKARLGDELYAIMYRKRQWAQSLKGAESEPLGWHPVADVSPERAYAILESGLAPDSTRPWSLVWRSERCGGLWSRPLEAGELTREGLSSVAAQAIEGLWARPAADGWSLAPNESEKDGLLYGLA